MTIPYTKTAYAQSSSTLISLTNSQRSSHGLPGLSGNSLLYRSAQTKADDMCNNNYWSHTSPNGTTAWDLMRSVGYSYVAAGENLAKGFSTDAGTITGWMNSPAHRANILNANFAEIGIGISNCGTQGTIIVAHYGARTVAAPQPPSPKPAPAAAAPAPKPQPTDSTPKVVPTTPTAKKVPAPKNTPKTATPTIVEEVMVEETQEVHIKELVSDRNINLQKLLDSLLYSNDMSTNDLIALLEQRQSQ